MAICSMLSDRPEPACPICPESIPKPCLGPFLHKAGNRFSKNAVDMPGSFPEKESLHRSMDSGEGLVSPVFQGWSDIHAPFKLLDLIERKPGELCDFRKGNGAHIIRFAASDYPKCAGLVSSQSKDSAFRILNSSLSMATS